MPNEGLIAIVDDDSSVREGVTDLLNSMGFDTETFESAEDFLASDLLASTICLITDGRMSGMTGFELHGRLVASGKRIPTILITAFPEATDRARALREGMCCYLRSRSTTTICWRACARRSHPIKEEINDELSKPGSNPDIFGVIPFVRRRFCERSDD